MSVHDVQIAFLAEASESEDAYSCMTEVPVPWPDALDVCRAWCADNVGTLIHGLHLRDNTRTVIGHLYYAFSSRALVAYDIEEGVAVVHCEWIQRRHQGKGYSRLLFEALIHRLEAEDCKGILVLATDDDQHMHHRHYARRGFTTLRQDGAVWLMYYPLRQERVKAKPLAHRIPTGRRYPVEVLVFTGGLCPYETVTALQALEVAREFGRRVMVKEIPASREALVRYGTVEGVWINGRRLSGGGLPEEAIRLAIGEALEG
ncbi:MAG: GNAT family N-acetyltransferase [Anaerolineae bacterium]|jgi:GNAT superfamily N-acetyltransferase